MIANISMDRMSNTGEIILVVACTENQSRGCPHEHQIIMTASMKTAIKHAKHLVRIGHGKSSKFNCRATCYPELAGEGIEYSWALHTKGWSKYQLLGKKRNEVTFQNRVKVCVMRPSTSLKIFDIRWRKLLCRIGGSQSWHNVNLCPIHGGKPGTCDSYENSLFITFLLLVIQRGSFRKNKLIVKKIQLHRPAVVGPA